MSAGRPNLLSKNGRNPEMDFLDRVLNDGEVEILLLDLDRQDRMAADYYRQRQSCLEEIKGSRGSVNKISDFQRLIAERDFIYNQEQDYIGDLNNVQGLYIKKKDMDAKGQRAPVDLLEKIKSLVVEMKAKKNRIDNQKVQFAQKFEKKRNGLGNDSMLNQTSAAGLSLNYKNMKGVDKELGDLANRINRLDDLKVIVR